MLESLRRHGCSASAVKAIEDAVGSLHGLLARAKRDRLTICAAAAGALDTPRERASMLRMRASATKANEFIHGVRFELFLSSMFVGPAGPRKVVDLAATTALHGVHRTRPGCAWPIYHTLEAYDDRRASRGVRAGRYRGASIPPLLAGHSSPEAASKWLRMRTEGGVQLVDLVDRGSERTGPLHFAFAECLRAAGSAGKSKTESRLLHLMNAPTERAIAEVWFHESVEIVNAPSALMVSSPNLHRPVMKAYSVERLPLEASATPIERPSLPREHDGAYLERLAQIAARLGAPLEAFRGYRLDVRHPPWMSALVLAFDG